MEIKALDTSGSICVRLMYRISVSCLSPLTLWPLQATCENIPCSCLNSVFKRGQYEFSTKNHRRLRDRRVLQNKMLLLGYLVLSNRIKAGFPKLPSYMLLSWHTLILVCCNHKGTNSGSAAFKEWTVARSKQAKKWINTNKTAIAGYAQNHPLPDYYFGTYPLCKCAILSLLYFRKIREGQMIRVGLKKLRSGEGDNIGTEHTLPTRLHLS